MASAFEEIEQFLAPALKKPIEHRRCEQVYNDLFTEWASRNDDEPIPTRS